MGLLALGVNIKSTLPERKLGNMSGTSVSSLFVTEPPEIGVPKDYLDLSLKEKRWPYSNLP